MIHRAALWISRGRWWTFAEFAVCICACSHTVTVVQTTSMIDERIWHRIIPWNQNFISRESLRCRPCMFLLTAAAPVSHFLCVFRIMFNLVSATSMVLTLFLFSHCLGAKGKWRILSVQTPMLWKAFNSTNWTHMQWSCQAKLLSHVKDQWGGRKTQTPLLSVYANRKEKRGETGSLNTTKRKLCCSANKESLSLEDYHVNLIRCNNFTAWLY